MTAAAKSMASWVCSGPKPLVVRIIRLRDPTGIKFGNFHQVVI